MPVTRSWISEYPANPALNVSIASPSDMPLITPPFLPVLYYPFQTTF
jgi:hypothetical protein